MKNNIRTCFFISVACLTLIGRQGFAQALPAPPNVVFILVDDLGWSDVGYNGSTIYETPNVGRLSGEGMVFTDFYSAGPVCSPTRASVLTGKYPVRTGITTYLLSPERDPPYINHYLDPSEFTIGEAFQSHNYATAYFGKWHLGYAPEHWAAKQGFELAKGGMDLPWAWEIAHPGQEPPMKEGHTRFFSPHHLTFMEDGPEGEYLTERLTNEAISFIEKHKEQPFFVFLSYHTVHTPLQAKPEVVEKYRAKIEQRGLLGIEENQQGSRKYQNLPEYAAMVHHMDENVGRLLESLKILGLEDNTIVVFTSDNGGKASVTSNAPLRGAKHDLYEGGIRVPLIVKWPGVAKAGAQNNFPLCSNDFFPTLLSLTGNPLMPDRHIDGISFKKLLTGEKSRLKRKALYWHYPHNRYEGAIRWKDYKLVLNYKTGKAELYDIAADLSESKDLSTVKPGKARKLKNKLQKWLVEVDARFPEDMSLSIN